MINNYLDPDNEDVKSKLSVLEPCYKCRYRFPSSEERCPLCGWDHDNKKYTVVNLSKIIKVLMILSNIKGYWADFFRR